MNSKFDKYIKKLVKEEKMDISNEFENRTELTMQKLPVNNTKIKQKIVRLYF